MIQRFQIEDLVVQDNSGVVFRALDTETGQTVALRRFFPFGPTGGGLNKDEQAAYDVAVERLAGVSHPALRAVICGACDPVDGMPFIATEWIEGNRLQSFVNIAPLAPAEAANLLGLALEVSQLLSEMLEEEAVWVETCLEAIVVGSEDSHRGFTFWISPLKWLGTNEGQHGLESIITLTEQVLGWQDQEISDQAGMGLGAWLNWLRASVKTASLDEAREMLAKSFGVAAPTPTKYLAGQTQTKQRPLVIRKKKKSSGMVFFMIGAFALLAIAGGGWAVIQWRNLNNTLPTLATAESPTIIPPPEIPVPVPVALPPAKNEVVPSLRKPRKTNKIFTPTDPALVDQKDKVATVEGILVGVNKNKKYPSVLWLEFSKSPLATEFMATVELDKPHKDLTETKLQLFIGKKIQISGKVLVKPSGKSSRPSISIMDPADIKEL